MTKYENDCVGCPPEWGCLQSSCPHYSVPHYYCDCCKDETDELYDYEDKQLCESCLLSSVPMVTESR